MTYRKKPCATPMCDGLVTSAKFCRPCYERARLHSPERQEWLKQYKRKKHVREMHREARRDYYHAGKNRGVCSICSGETSDPRARRCFRCFQSKFAPAARAKGLAAIHGRPM